MKNLLTFTIALAVLSGGSVFLSGCQKPAPPPAPLTKLTGGTMGTFYEVTIAGDLSEAEQQELQTDIEETLAEVNRQMSTYDPESEISHFNRSESTDWLD
ncbi:FAD:protein FMN transferase ApbE, partial [bacterium]|nr:FAD:protein FMN transferase ApbE [bacterium]